MGADKSTWQFPANEPGKVVGWGPTPRSGMVNIDVDAAITDKALIKTSNLSDVDNATLAAGNLKLIERDTVPLLLADTVLDYSTGTGKTKVATSQIVHAGGFRYSVAASGASDHHLTTAGGVKLYVLPLDNAVQPDQVGAAGDGVTDDTAKVQLAIDIAGILGVRFKFTKSHVLSTVAALPDGHAGNYCLMVSRPTVIDGEKKGTFIVPGDVHGLLTWNTDDVTIQNGRYVKGSGASGTIGHHIRVLGPRANIKIVGNYLEDCSDAAIGLSYDLNSLIAAPTEDNAFAFGPRNIEIVGNTAVGNNGDTMVELQGVTDLLCADNTGIDIEGHVIRIVGVRNGRILRNHGQDCGVAGDQSSAVIAAYSGGGTFSGTPLLFRNKNIIIKGNTSENCWDGIWLGLGAEELTVTGNDMEVLRYGCQIGHINGEAAFGLKDSIVRRNVFRGGTHSVYITSNAAAPAATDVMRDVDLSANIFTGYSVAGIFESASTGRLCKRVTARGNHYDPIDKSVTSTAVCVQVTNAEDWDLRNSLTYLENGAEFKIFTPTGKTKFPRLERYKVVRASNNLNRPVSGSGAPWKKWQRVTLETDGALPAPLATNTLYWLFNVTPTTCRVATSEANATAGTAVTLTTDGTGNHYVVPVDE